VPFLIITGTFHLVGRTPAGNPSGFAPDGDSVQFRPTNPSLLERLTRVERPYRLSSIGSTQLRFEGIDALELHFDGSHQPRPLADRARDFLTGELDLNPVPYRAPANIRVRPPVERDATPGYILSRALEVTGRPVAFAFVAVPPAPAGSEVFLRAGLLRQSLNYRSLDRGQSYPLFYDTLFADLRTVLAEAATTARQARRGLWRSDRSRSGLVVRSQTDLEQNGVIFPKLFRRLTEYLRRQGRDLSGFLPWLEATREQVLELPTRSFTHFEDVLDVQANTIKLRPRPEELVFVSAKSTSTVAAPWLAV
jgi:endonuclease YncB( thermonuclease family)